MIFTKLTSSVKAISSFRRKNLGHIKKSWDILTLSNVA